MGRGWFIKTSTFFLSSRGALFFLSFRGMLFFLSYRGTQVPRDPSLALGATKKGARGDILHLVMLSEAKHLILHPVLPSESEASLRRRPLASARGDKKESASEASLASLGTASLGRPLTFKFFMLPSIKIYRKQKRKKQKEVQPWR